MVKVPVLAMTTAEKDDLPLVWEWVVNCAKSHKIRPMCDNLL
jgi:hypothetical protein